MITILGVDEVGDALIRFKCGHLLGWPVTAIQAAADAGAGFAFQHSACDLTELVAPDDLRRMAESLTEYLGTQNGTSVEPEADDPQNTGSKPEE